jgi:phospholipid transport system substrate-binding protein
MRKFLLALAVMLVAVPARAEEPPAKVIEGLYAVILDVMKNAEKLGFKGRRDRLAPVIDKAYNLPLMARLSVGPDWQKLSPEDQKKVTDAFRELTVSTYAGRFDGFSGEQLVVEPGVQDAANGGKIVPSKIITSKGEPIQLNYLMREVDGSWKVIDVFLKGTVSELATRRSEFSSVLRRDGAEALLKLMHDKAAAEAKG